MKRRLTDRQLAVYVAARTMEREEGGFPGTRKLSTQLGCTEQNIHELYERLTERGWIKRVSRGVYAPVVEEVAA